MTLHNFQDELVIDQEKQPENDLDQNEPGDEYLIKGSFFGKYIYPIEYGLLYELKSRLCLNNY